MKAGKRLIFVEESVKFDFIFMFFHFVCLTMRLTRRGKQPLQKKTAEAIPGRRRACCYIAFIFS
jgi:hypothetical protein